MVRPFDWIYVKSWLSLYLQVSDDVLHMGAGMLVLTLSAFAFRRPPWHWLPWAVVAVTEGANEAFDLIQTTYWTSEGNLPAAWHDYWITLLWPTVILATYGWLGRRAAARPPEPVLQGGQAPDGV